MNRQGYRRALPWVAHGIFLLQTCLFIKVPENLQALNCTYVVEHGLLLLVCQSTRHTGFSTFLFRSP